MPLLAEAYSDEFSNTLEYPDWFKHWLTTEYLKQPFNKLLDDDYNNHLILIQSPSKYIALNKETKLYGSFKAGAVRPTFMLDNEALTLNTLVKCYHGIVTELGTTVQNVPTCLRYNVHYLKYADTDYTETSNCTVEAETTTTAATDSTTTTTTTVAPDDTVPPEAPGAEALGLRSERQVQSTTTTAEPPKTTTKKNYSFYPFFL